MPQRESPLVRGISTQHLLIKSLAPYVGDGFDVGTVTVFTGPNNSGTTDVRDGVARLVPKSDPHSADRGGAHTRTPRAISDLP